MNKQFLRFTFFLLICLTVPLTATAQLVDIPDSNLRAAVETALGKASGATITTDEMATLTRLEAQRAGIHDLNGLEAATNLTSLNLRDNSISDISALGGLTQLTALYLSHNSISDRSALGGLTRLTTLGLERNSISDISVLGGLTQLTTLYLGYNSISDISVLGGLTRLTSLGLEGNSISDISVLGGLTRLTSLGLEGNSISDISVLGGLTQLTTLGLGYNSISDISVLGGLTQLTWLELRNNSISDISALSGLTRLTTLGLNYNSVSDISPLVANTGLGSGDTVKLRENHLSALSFDTHIPTLQSRGVTVDAPASVGEPYTVRLIYFLPNDRQPQPDIDTKMDTLIKEVQQFYADQMESHGFGRKTFRFETDTTGKAVVHRMNGRFNSVHYRNSLLILWPEIWKQFDRSRTIYLCALEMTGPFDDNVCGLESGRTALIPASGLCFSLPVAAHELGHTFGLEHDFRDNTYIMSYGGRSNRLSECAAEWLEVHRYFNAKQSSQGAHKTTVQMSPPSLASPPNTIRLRFEVTDPDGLHQAQLFRQVPSATNISLRREAPSLIACKRLTGTTSTVEFVTTELTPADETVFLQFIDVHGNTSGKTFPIDITSLLTPPKTESPLIVADVNGDGSVNILDLVSVASAFGRAETHPAADVNGDEVVNILDLVLVAGMFDSAAAAPAAQPQIPETLTAVEIQGWLTDARALEIGDPIMKRGFLVLEQLLISLTPKETELLSNYPNPFNPETWIPYRLAEDAFVTLTIYDISGQVVRTLEVGHRIAAVYESRSKAIYWDGRNGLGEEVASGVYYYHLSAGNYAATRKMAILK